MVVIIKTSRTNLRFIFGLSLMLVLLISSLLLIDQSDGKKLKKEQKKLIKSLLKGLVIKNLSTKKSFLPLPVPIPGKWQDFLNDLHERRAHDELHRGARPDLAAMSLLARQGGQQILNKIQSNSNSGFIGSDASSRAAVASKLSATMLDLVSLAAKNYNNNNKQSSIISSKSSTTSKQNNISKLLIARRVLTSALSNANGLSGSSSSSSPAGSFSSAAVAAEKLNSLKKLTRTSAAKYAAKMFADQFDGKPNDKKSKLHKTGAKAGLKLGSVALNGLFNRQFAGLPLSGSAGIVKKGNSVASSATSAAISSLASAKPEPNAMVTLHNVVKLAKQLSELETTGKFLFNISKKSIPFLTSSSTSSSASSSRSSNIINNLIDKDRLIPYLAMNINNKKSLTNKMNYIHSLTSDLNRGIKTQ